MNKHLQILIILIFTTSCSKKVEQSRGKKWTCEDSLQKVYRIGTSNKISGKILGVEYHAFSLETDYSGCITNSKNDTLFKDKDLNPNPEFIDFDKDGITDVTFKSNLKNEYDLIQFDSIAKRFKKVKDFKLFLDPTKIQKSKYWFSYHSAGCADECWESDLFYLDNFSAIRIGNISKYYVDENGKIEFTINRIVNNKLITLEQLDNNSIERWEENKFESIEKYWIENYGKFTKADR